jgi:predicted ABC-type ATPase
LSDGIEVRIWFVGLSSPELHVQRVRLRVARGGHDIPEETIRERYDRSRINLIEMIEMIEMIELPKAPRWTRPVVAAAIKLST